jgi:hypothetical protein
MRRWALYDNGRWWRMEREQISQMASRQITFADHFRESFDAD